MPASWRKQRDMRRSGGRRPGGAAFRCSAARSAAMPATPEAAAGNKAGSTPSASHLDSSARMIAWAWASGSRRAVDSPLESGPDGYGLTSSAIRCATLSWNHSRSRPLAGSLWIAARSFVVALSSGRQFRSGQRGKQTDRGVAPRHARSTAQACGSATPGASAAVLPGRYDRTARRSFVAIRRSRR